MVLYAHSNEHHPDGERHEQRSGHTSVGWHVEERDDFEQVADGNEQEQCGQKRHVRLIAVTDTGLSDLFFDEFNDALGQYPEL